MERRHLRHAQVIKRRHRDIVNNMVGAEICRGDVVIERVYKYRVPGKTCRDRGLETARRRYVPQSVAHGDIGEHRVAEIRDLEEELDQIADTRSITAGIDELAKVAVVVD